MAIKIEDIEILKEYMTGVLNRADHHALNVNEVILALAGGIIWKSTGKIEVKQYSGTPANILWINVNNNRYCFAFNHDSGNIEIRKKSIKGSVLHEINNNTSILEVKSIFNQL